MTWHSFQNLNPYFRISLQVDDLIGLCQGHLLVTLSCFIFSFLAGQMAQNSTMPMSLGRCCYGDEAKKSCKSERSQINNKGMDFIQPPKKEMHFCCWSCCEFSQQCHLYLCCVIERLLLKWAMGVIVHVNPCHRHSPVVSYKLKVSEKVDGKRSFPAHLALSSWCRWRLQVETGIMGSGS